VDLIDGDVSITAGMSTILTPGHTPGHQCLLISSGGEKAIVMGDVCHTPAQLTHTDWNPTVEVDPVQSASTRAALLDRIEQEGLTVCAGHFGPPSIGTFVRVAGRRRWQPLATSGAYA